MKSPALKNNKSKSRLSTALISGGALLVAAAIGLGAYNLWDDSRAQESVDQIMEQLKPRQESMQGSSEDLDSSGELTGDSFPGIDDPLPGETSDPNMALREMPVVEIDGQRYIGTVAIPSLALELPVMETWDYKKLKISPCRYKGTVYQNNMIICAHNYESHFGRLKNLKIGDSVLFTDVDGNEFWYTVVELDTLATTAVEEMEAGVWDLTLFTCTLGGRTRVTVRCNAVK